MVRHFLLPLLSLPVACWAQPPLPFPPIGEMVRWNHEVSNANISGIDSYTSSGPMVEIDGTAYHRIIHSHRYDVILGMGQTTVWESYGDTCCYLRQDEEGVIHYRQDPSQPEEVFFDHAIEVGETVPASWTLVKSTVFTGPVTVADIEVVTDGSGVAHRVYHFAFSGSPFSASFIEGVGCTAWFESIFPSNIGAPGSTLRCVSVEEAFLYPFVGTTDCPALVSGIRTTAPGKVSLQPWPSPSRDGQVTLTFAEPVSGELLIGDATGRVVHREQLRKGTNLHHLDLGALAAGLYHLHLLTPDGPRTGRLVRE